MLVVDSSLLVYSGFRFAQASSLADTRRRSADPQSCIWIARSLTAQYLAIRHRSKVPLVASASDKFPSRRTVEGAQVRGQKVTPNRKAHSPKQSQCQNKAAPE